MKVAEIARNARAAAETARGGRARAGRSVSFAASPVLTLSLPMWRSQFVVFLIFVAFVALVARAFWIQGPGNAFYEEEGKKRMQRTLEMPATRGKILDRNGVVLATSLPVKAIWADPDAVPDNLPEAKWQQLAQLLGANEKDLRAKLKDGKNFVYLKHQVVPEVADKIAALKIDGVYQQREYKRYYPEGEAVAHVIGFTDVQDKGVEGIEYTQQPLLAGKAGRRQVIKDRLGRIVEDVGVLSAPRNGQELQLSIDSKIQYLAYNELKAAVESHHAKGGGVVVVDAQTGEILALANLPSYNPNARSAFTPEQQRNRVVTDMFEPGSTMKPITIALALERGVVTPTTVIDTSGGKLTIGTSTISDAHPHGPLTVEEVIQKSSNVGTGRIAMQLKAQDMWEMFQSVGLGQAPKIGMPGAVAGRLRPWANWKQIEQVTMSYGYGLSASLLQLARAYTIFARDGELIPLSIMKVNGAVPGTRVVSPATAAKVRKMLEMVTLPGGTAPKAQTIGYRVGGKTGTAYKQEGRGYAQNKYRGFFVGIAPMSKPRVIVAVMIDEPTAGGHFGGDTAAPVFSAIVGNTLRTLGIQPDSNSTKLDTGNAEKEAM